MGFPIRTSPDQCLVDGSPELFAVTHVLHRFLAPRHPPLALISLEKLVIYSCEHADTHPKGNRAGVFKMLVLALQFSKCYLTPEPTPNIRHRKGQQTRQAQQCGMKKPKQAPSKQKRRQCAPEPATSGGTESLTTNARYSDRRASAPTGVSCNRKEQTSLID